MLDSVLFPKSMSVSFQQSPSVNGGPVTPTVAVGTPFFVDTGSILNTNHVSTYGVEALWVRGPLSVQSEAMAAQVYQPEIIRC